jgi:hypothetical protein
LLHHAEVIPHGPAFGDSAVDESVPDVDVAGVEAGPHLDAAERPVPASHPALTRGRSVRSAAMEPADRLELHELPGRYGDAIDDRNWEGLGRIFTEDATFDLTGLGGPKLASLAEIRRFMDETATHPQTRVFELRRRPVC